MNKKEINGITNPVLRSIVMLSRACTRSNAVDHAFSLAYPIFNALFTTIFSRIPSFRDGGLNRNADEHPDDSYHNSSKVEPITSLSSFAISRCVQKGKERKGGEEKDGEEEFDDEEERILSFVPSIEADKGKRRLAFSSMHSLSLFFLFHSLFSPSHLTLAAALQLSATHAPPSLPPSRTTAQPLVPASS